MTRHLSSEALSALLDGETSAAEAQSANLHLAACAACRGRLDALRHTVHAFTSLTPVAPPPELARRVHQRIAAAAAAADGTAAAAAPGMPGAALAGRFFASLRRIGPAAGRVLRTLGVGDSPWRAASLSGAGAPLGLLLVVGVALLLTYDGVGAGGRRFGGFFPGAAVANPNARPEFRVSESFGDAPALPRETTSEVAGRVFVLSDDVWVERGLDAVSAQPRARVDARSPQGRLLLARFSDLGVLLTDGSRVVLLDNRQTLELSNNS